MAAAIVKLEDDAFVEWSTVVDAPVSATLTKMEAAAQFGVDRVERADTNWHSWLNRTPGKSAFDVISFNRAGPNECCLTPEAIARRYRPEGHTEPLRPEDILVYATSDGDKLFFVPWRPGEAPAVIDDTVDLHASVPATADEVDRWHTALHGS